MLSFSLAGYRFALILDTFYRCKKDCIWCLESFF
jgi:hypothetical protein